MRQVAINDGNKKSESTEMTKGSDNKFVAD